MLMRFGPLIFSLLVSAVTVIPTIWPDKECPVLKSGLPVNTIEKIIQADLDLAAALNLKRPSGVAEKHIP